MLAALCRQAPPCCRFVGLRIMKHLFQPPWKKRRHTQDPRGHWVVQPRERMSSPGLSVLSPGNCLVSVHSLICPSQFMPHPRPGGHRSLSLAETRMNHYFCSLLPSFWGWPTGLGEGWWWWWLDPGHLTHTHTPPPICLSVSFSALQETQIPEMPSEVFLEEGEGAGAQAALRDGKKKKKKRSQALHAMWLAWGDPDHSFTPDKSEG